MAEATGSAETSTAVTSDAREVCRMFRNTGKCRFENDCKYEHSEGEPILPKKRGVCFNFRDNNDCKFGDRCRFSHGGDETDDGTVKKSSEVCRTFRDKGTCRYGDNCRHQHVEGPPKTEGADDSQPKEKSERKKRVRRRRRGPGAKEEKETRAPADQTPVDTTPPTIEKNPEMFDETGKEICRNFRNRSRCRWGDRCNFSHQPGPPIGNVTSTRRRRGPKQPRGDGQPTSDGQPKPRRERKQREPKPESDGKEEDGDKPRSRRRKPRGPGVCFNFRDNNNCEYADECRFRHGTDDNREIVQPGARRKASGICYRFRDEGACQFGENCRFSHDLNAVEPAAEDTAAPSA